MKTGFVMTTLFFVGISAFAQQPSPNPDSSRVIRRVEHRLGITEVQREQMKSILQQERPTLSQLHTELASEHTELAAIPSFNEVQTRAILAKYADTNTAAAVERDKLRAEIFAIMTPVQREKLADLRERLGAAFDDRIQTLGDKL